MWADSRILQGHYQLASACITITRMIAERVTLYMRVNTSGENITVGIEKFPIEDSVPKGDGREWFLR